MDKKNIIIDLVALVVYILSAWPALTGLGLHEWIGLGIVFVLFVHCCVHMDWVVETTKSAFKNPSFVRTGNWVLDFLLLVVLLLCAISGLFVSGTVLPAFGFFANGYYFWDPLHAFSAKLLLALLLVHVVVHLKWFTNVLSKFNKDKEDEPAVEAETPEAE